MARTKTKGRKTTTGRSCSGISTRIPLGVLPRGRASRSPSPSAGVDLSPSSSLTSPPSPPPPNPPNRSPSPEETVLTCEDPSKHASLLLRIKKRAESDIEAGNHPFENFCALCRDGGLCLVECKQCGRSNCTRCIIGLEAVTEEDLEKYDYICPSCHGRREPFFGLWSGSTPISRVGMKISERAFTTHGTRFDTEPLAIVEFRIKSLPKLGSPGKILYVYLQSTYAPNPGDLVYVECPFEVDETDIEKHSQAVAAAIKKIKHIRRIVVMVSTHTDEDRGDLLYSGNGFDDKSKSAEPHEFFDAVIGERVKALVQGAKRSILFLTVCGQVTTKHGARASLEKALEEFRFSAAIAFTEPSIDPHQTSPLVNKFTMDTMITGHKIGPAIRSAVTSTPTSADTGIVCFRWEEDRLVTQRYELVHHKKRPNGQRVPLQCPKCRRIRPWIIPSKPAKGNGPMVFLCGGVKMSGKRCTGKFKPKQLKGYTQLPDDNVRIFTKFL